MAVPEDVLQAIHERIDRSFVEWYVKVNETDAVAPGTPPTRVFFLVMIGSFNPVHKGHLYALQAAVRLLTSSPGVLVCGAIAMPLHDDDRAFERNNWLKSKARVKLCRFAFANHHYDWVLVSDHLCRAEEPVSVIRALNTLRLSIESIKTPFASAAGSRKPPRIEVVCVAGPTQDYYTDRRDFVYRNIGIVMVQTATEAPLSKTRSNAPILQYAFMPPRRPDIRSRSLRMVPVEQMRVKYMCKGVREWLMMVGLRGKFIDCPEWIRVYPPRLQHQECPCDEPRADGDACS